MSCYCTVNVLLLYSKCLTTVQYISDYKSIQLSQTEGHVLSIMNSRIRDDFDKHNKNIKKSLSVNTVIVFLNLTISCFRGILYIISS